jgi:hypothetical protein
VKPAKLHPRQKNIIRRSAEWLAYPDRPGKLQGDLDYLAGKLAEAAPAGKIGTALMFLANHYSIAACDAFGRGDAADLATFIGWTIDLNALLVRLQGAYVVTNPDEDTNTPQEFWCGLHTAGPLLLSDWHGARVCAEFYVAMAEKDHRLRHADRRLLRHGTVDPFLIRLFAESFGIETSFQPTQPLIPQYETLLQTWRRDDVGAFQLAMQAAAEFHVTRSKFGTDRTTYEFEHYFDQVFPVELLAVQALRRRDSLPDWQTGHPLVDTTWPVIRDLPLAQRHPLAVAAEQQFLPQPNFR